MDAFEPDIYRLVSKEFRGSGPGDRFKKHNLDHKKAGTA